MRHTKPKPKRKLTLALVGKAVSNLKSRVRALEARLKESPTVLSSAIGFEILATPEPDSIPFRLLADTKLTKT